MSKKKKNLKWSKKKIIGLERKAWYRPKREPEAAWEAMERKYSKTADLIMRQKSK